MGWDITYHPVADSEIRDIYFRALEDVTLVEALQPRFRIEPFYMEQLQERIDEARSISADVPFEKGHALYLAIVAGHLRRYHYLRGSAGGRPVLRGLAATGAATVGGRRCRQPPARKLRWWCVHHA